jgi:copper chaperone CopZ
MFKLNRPTINKKLTIEGLHCNGCAKRVENALLKNKAVKEVSVSFEEGNALLTLKKEMTFEELKSIIEDLGFTLINME